MSMFSGLGNQISGFVSSKMGKGEAPPEGGEPPAQQEMMIDENGQEVPVQPAAGGGAMGFAQGLMAKAAAAKDGMAQKAGALGGLQVDILTREGGDNGLFITLVPQSLIITFSINWLYNLGY